MSYLIFDGVNLTEHYGLVVSGSGVYNAPVRSVESIAILGRNGNLVRDFGNYENIEVVYAGSGLRRNDAANLDALRAFLAAHQDGYYQLADSYHPDEFRWARFMGPFSPTFYAGLRVAEFDLSFDCKPKRFLLNGEEPRTMAGALASSFVPYHLEDFASTIRTALSSAAWSAGYSITEISALRFGVLPCDFSALYSGLGGDDAIVTFSLGYTLPYFFLVSDADPISGSSFTTMNGMSRKNMASELNGFSYLIQPYGFNAQVIANGLVYARDGLATDHNLMNPEAAPAKPKIRITVTNGQSYENYIAGVNDCGIFLDGYAQGDTIEIDAETMNAAYLLDDGTENVTMNANQLVSFSGDEITLGPGLNKIYTTYGSTAVVIPRWCRL